MITRACIQQVNNLVRLITPNSQVGGATYMPPAFYGTTTTALFSDIPVTFTPPYQAGGCGCGVSMPALPIPDGNE